MYSQVYEQYFSLTGNLAAQQFSVLGCRQCRYNYDDEKDVRSIDKALEKRNISYDGMWIDIDHADNKRYCTYTGLIKVPRARPLL